MSISIAGEVFLLDEGATFFGAISDTPFSTVTIQITDPDYGYAVSPRLDNISFSVVPEPSTALLLLLGLAALTTRSAGRAA